MNVDMDDKRLDHSLGNSEALWHTDMSYKQIPPLGSALYSREIPNTGGDTCVSNMYLAYEDLSSELLKSIAGKCAVHDESRNSAGILRPGLKIRKMQPRHLAHTIRLYAHTPKQVVRHYFSAVALLVIFLDYHTVKAKSYLTNFGHMHLKINILGAISGPWVIFYYGITDAPCTVEICLIRTKDASCIGPKLLAAVRFNSELQIISLHAMRDI